MKTEPAVQKAQEILMRFGVNSAPVDVKSISEKLDVSVVERSLEDEVSGFLIVKNNHAVIAVNSNHHLNRRRFTIAHELGHYLLHHRQGLFYDSRLTFFRDPRSSEGIDAQEIEANKFAASLLMPESLIQPYFQKRNFDLHNPFDLAYLASQFKVSEQALTIQLVKLNFIEA